MKRVIFIAVFLFAAIQSNAQITTYKGGNEESRRVLDSVKYILPQFTSGIVTFNSGEKSQGDVNICTVDQLIHFIDNTTGEVTPLNTNDEIFQVSVKGKNYINSRYGYVEIEQMAGDIMLGEVRSLVFTKSDANGSFGTSSQAVSVETARPLEFFGWEKVDIAANTDASFTYRKTPYLYRRGVFLLANKKNFMKCFPDKKALIERYTEENNVDFEDMAQVTAMFKTIGE